MVQVPSGGAASAAPAAGGAAPAAAAEKEEEKKEEEKVRVALFQILTPLIPIVLLCRRPCIADVEPMISFYVLTGRVRRRYGLRSVRLNAPHASAFLLRLQSHCIVMMSVVCLRITIPL